MRAPPPPRGRRLIGVVVAAGVQHHRMALQLRNRLQVRRGERPLGCPIGAHGHPRQVAQVARALGTEVLARRGGIQMRARRPGRRHLAVGGGRGVARRLLMHVEAVVARRQAVQVELDRDSAALRVAEGHAADVRARAGGGRHGHRDLHRSGQRRRRGGAERQNAGQKNTSLHGSLPFRRWLTDHRRGSASMDSPQSVGPSARTC